VSLKSLLGGVMDGELGHPDLLRRVVDGIAKLKRHADRGVEVLPPEVEVHITVGEGSVQVIERFVNDPAFDREVEAALRNKLVRAREDRMPVRRYFVKAGKRTQVTAKESPPKAYQLKIEGGDRAGNAIPMQGDKRVFLVGRGPWHGDDQQVANDVIVSETEKAVSRRAAISEEALKDYAWVSFCGKRRSRGRPGEIVLINARETVVASPDRSE